MSSIDIGACLEDDVPARRLTVTLDRAWSLAPSVALRPEPFGALAYNFDNRRLTFLKRPGLVALVRGLGEHADVRSTLVAVGVPTPQHAAYLEALDALAAAGVILPRHEVATSTAKESA
ncbi:mycofactocin biosynthesis chaperone MftB [Janibacter terrae]|uniref:Mycofactocin biosynthesis chaperone MftB n=1 Tax=Janibacter terrae TaxID=103817 RepID=A0ABZ2FJ16_9MICO